MSTPVNQTLNLRAQALTPNQISVNTSQDFAAPFVRSNQFDLAAIQVTANPIAVQGNVTQDINGKDGKPIGSVTFNPEDPQELLNASEQLMKSDNINDQIKAQELMSRAIRIMNAKIKQAELLHTIALKALDSMRA